MVLQRYVIIVATAFGGAWTMIVGGLALAGERAAARRRTASRRVDSLSDDAAPGQDGCRSPGSRSASSAPRVQLGITGRKS